MYALGVMMISVICFSALLRANKKAVPMQTKIDPADLECGNFDNFLTISHAFVSYVPTPHTRCVTHSIYCRCLLDAD